VAREHEIENMPALFELGRDRLYLFIELSVIVALLLIALLLWLTGRGEASIGVLGGSVGFGGLATLMHHPFNGKD
jgi:hypothetical protein